MKKKAKTNIELAKEIRGTWSINPVTRVHDNGIKENKKKLRHQGRKASIEGLKEFQQKDKRSEDRTPDL